MLVKLHVAVSLFSKIQCRERSCNPAFCWTIFLDAYEMNRSNTRDVSDVRDSYANVCLHYIIVWEMMNGASDLAACWTLFKINDYLHFSWPRAGVMLVKFQYQWVKKFVELLNDCVFQVFLNEVLTLLLRNWLIKTSHIATMLKLIITRPQGLFQSFSVCF